MGENGEGNYQVCQRARYGTFKAKVVLLLGREKVPRSAIESIPRQDGRLLRAVYQCTDARPAEIAQIIKEHQERILERLGQVSLPQVLRHEEAVASHDFLISGLVSVLLSMWQESLTPQDPVIQGVILGQQKYGWKASFLQSAEHDGPIDLADSLVIWLIGSHKVNAAVYNIFFSHQSWYLPFADELIWDTHWFTDTSKPFAIALAWRHSRDDLRSGEQQNVPCLDLDEPAKLLIHMLMLGLKYRLDDSSGKSLARYADTRSNAGGSAGYRWT